MATLARVGHDVRRSEERLHIPANLRDDPDILRRLLNDLLERRDAQTIEQIEYLPGEPLPMVEGAKLSILDVRCRDRMGTTFLVEMQLKMPSIC
ncbi:MAG TPA: PD-(D/E)XK nuclease family transposase [Kofleriaceae bacterium]|jgi:hypothetical protein|nr:PD-(D/E)XK nuclease family transposase [Kofleriaceae bacterium]